MKIILAFTIIAAMISCNHQEQKAGKKIDPVVQPLIGFIDSIHAIDPANWIKSASEIPDSVFKSQESMNVELSESDFKKLMKQAEQGKIDYKIFSQFSIDEKFEDGEIVDGKLSITLFKFDGFDKFAIEIYHLGWESNTYFFERNKVVAKHHIFHKYGLEIESFKDEKNETVIYYPQNFESGTGVWWWNYNFFKYKNGKLIPVLDVLQNSNIANPNDYRTLWFETFIEKTKPLTLKMVYQTGIPDVQGYEPVEIQNDSTSAQYRWNEALDKYEPDFSNSKLNENQIVSFYLNANELLYIHSNHSLFKEILNGKDQKKKRAAMKYLARVRKVNEF